MVFPVLAGVPVAGVLQLNPGKVPVADELVQLVVTKPIGQLSDGLVSNHRGVPANDMIQLKRVVETLVSVPDIIARHDLLGYVGGFGDGKPLLIVGQALTLLVCANGEHADVDGFCKSALGHVSPPAQPLQGLSQHCRPVPEVSLLGHIQEAKRELLELGEGLDHLVHDLAILPGLLGAGGIRALRVARVGLSATDLLGQGVLHVSGRGSDTNRIAVDDLL